MEYIYIIMEKDIYSSVVFSILIIFGIIFKNIVEFWDIDDYIFL